MSLQLAFVSSFESPKFVARILHPLDWGSWAELDSVYRHRATAVVGRYPWPHPAPLRDVAGLMEDDAVGALTDLCWPITPPHKGSVT